MKPPTVVDLVWEHDLVLSGKSGAATMTLDSAGQAGPSPMQTLGFAVLGCMAMDVVHVLRKGRHDLRGLKAGLVAERAPEEPRRFTGVTIHFTITGQVPPEPIQRAIDLSRDKYCSVWNSLRQDIPLNVTFVVEAADNHRSGDNQ
jgi:putative redox protein